MTSKKLRLFAALTVCCLIFIWGNSLLPGEISAAISNWVKDLLSFLLPGRPRRPGSGLLRKIAHFTEFALLGICLSCLLRHWGKSARFALLLGAAAACIDETIQVFVPGRGPALRDVLIDCSGVAAGMILLHFGHTYIRKRKQHLEE